MDEFYDEKPVVMFYLLKNRIDDCIKNDLDLDNVMESIFTAYFDGELTSSQYSNLISKII